MSLIIIEGVDNTGKSTLAEALAGTLPGETIVKHWDRPTSDDAYKEYIDPISLYRPRTGVNVVCDRHYLGERVWPLVFDRPTILPLREKRVVEDALHRVGAVLVLCERSSDDVQRANELEEGAPQYDVAEAQRLFREEWADSRLISVLHRHEELDRSLETIVDIATCTEEVA